MMQWDRSPWYRPGDWALPRWWTDGILVRGAIRMTNAEQTTFYNGRWVREILNHDGGMTVPPATTRRIQ